MTKTRWAFKVPSEARDAAGILTGRGIPSKAMKTTVGGTVVEAAGSRVSVEAVLAGYAPKATFLDESE